jgi:hypothetical protein
MATSPYNVICPLHGQVPLTYDQYIQQMMRPDDVWRCPHMGEDERGMGPCGCPSEFDDDAYEASQAEDED